MNFPRKSLGETYEKISRLGSGGFANVFKIKHLETGETFAAKIIKESFLEEDFLEVLIMKNLHH